MQIALKITADNAAEMFKILNAIDTALTAEQKTQVRVTAGLKAAIDEELTAKEKVIEPPVESAAKPRGRPPKAAVVEKEEEPARKLKVVPKEDTPKQITMVDVRNAMVAYLAAHGEKESGKLLRQYGNADRLSQLKPEYFAAVYAAATKPAEKLADVFDDDISDVSA